MPKSNVSAGIKPGHYHLLDATKMINMTKEESMNDSQLKVLTTLMAFWASTICSCIVSLHVGDASNGFVMIFAFVAMVALNAYGKAKKGL
jgi:hypothetical protein